MNDGMVLVILLEQKVKIADVFDALSSDRVYKKAWPLEEVLELFNEEKGKHFDPRLIDIFMDNLDEFLQIKDTFRDIN